MNSSSQESPSTLIGGSDFWDVANSLGQDPAGNFDRTPGFVDPTDAKLIAWLRSVLRFTRPDGSVVFGPPTRAPSRLGEIERWVRRVGDPASARVIGWWRSSNAIVDEVGWVAPPLPTEMWSDRPLAILRPDWTARGDYVAIDHQWVGSYSSVEVAGRGILWLGSRWSSPKLATPTTAARTIFASSGPFADAYEWQFQAGEVAVTRTAILIRGAGLAVLMQTEEGCGAGTSEVCWSLPSGMESRRDASLQTLVLTPGRGRPMARLIPLGLDTAPDLPDQESLVVDGNQVRLRQKSGGPNRCLALLISWNKKSPRSWRTLTVAEKSSICPPGTAFAARVGWGVGQNGLLIYRSLGPPGLRSLLGHQTKARLLIAGFSPTGEVHPWIKDQVS